MSEFQTRYVVVTVADGNLDNLDSIKEFKKDGYMEMFLDEVHPSRQLNLVLSTLNEIEGKFIWVVNSDILMSHINSLILLSREKDASLSEELGYEGKYINDEDISVFEYHKRTGNLVKLEIGEFGYEIPWMTKIISKLNENLMTILTNIEEKEKQQPTKKIKLTRTTVMTYEPDLSFYPDGFTLEQIAEMDSKSDDLELLFEEVDSDEVVWEIIESTNE